MGVEEVGGGEEDEGCCGGEGRRSAHGRACVLCVFLWGSLWVFVSMRLYW